MISMTKDEQDTIDKEAACALGVEITKLIKAHGPSIGCSFVVLQVGNDLIVCANGNIQDIAQATMQGLFNTIHDTPAAVTLAGYRRPITPEEEFMRGVDADAGGH